MIPRDSLALAAERWPDSPAYSDEGASVCYAEANVRAAAFAALLFDRGLRPGDRLALLSRNSRACLTTIHAAHKLGISLVMLHFRGVPAEWREQIELTQPKMLLHSKDFTDRCASLPVPQISLEPAVEEACLSGKRHEGAGLDPLSEAAIIFTTGSEGRPKGVMLSWENIYANARASNAFSRLAGGDTWLLSLPLCRIGGFAIAWRCVLAGASVVAIRELSAAAVHHALHTCRITHASLVPPVLAGLVGLLENNSTPMTPLAFVQLGGAAFAPALLDEALRKGLPVVASYGLTEAGSTVAAERMKEIATGSSSGIPLPGFSLRIKGDNGECCRPGEIGHIELKGEAIARCCLTAHGTEPLVSADGWLTTGDLGSLDASGRLCVSGRWDNGFISGGENISAWEIERAAEGFPGVSAAGCVAVEDPQWGERPVLFVETAAPHQFARQELQAHLAAKLARFKVPKHIVLVHALARRPDGSIDYPSLRKLWRLDGES